jgi:hypothetical protein
MWGTGTFWFNTTQHAPPAERPQEGRYYSAFWSGRDGGRVSCMHLHVRRAEAEHCAAGINADLESLRDGGKPTRASAAAIHIFRTFPDTEYIGVHVEEL